MARSGQKKEGAKYPLLLFRQSADRQAILGQMLYRLALVLQHANRNIHFGLQARRFCYHTHDALQPISIAGTDIAQLAKLGAIETLIMCTNKVVPN